MGQPTEALSWARRAFSAGSSASRPLWWVCERSHWDAFACVWSYFRWADDIVDAPNRDAAAVQAFVADQSTLLAGEREAEALAEVALQHALAHPAVGTRLHAASVTMLAALAFDAARGPEPMPAAALDAQLDRIGGAFAEAVWACTGAAGSASEPARSLARCATAAHHLRDLHEDLALGYCNVSVEDVGAGLSGSAMAVWAQRRANTVDAAFAEGLRGLGGTPLRTRAPLTILALAYRRGLRGWVRRIVDDPPTLSCPRPLQALGGVV